MFKTLISALFGSTVQMLARTALKFLGGAALAWLLAKHVDPGQASNLVGYLSGAAMTGVGIWLSQRNSNDGKAQAAVAASVGYDTGQAHAIQKAMQAGVDVQVSADTTKIAAVADAMKTADQASKQDKVSIVAALKTGAF